MNVSDLDFADDVCLPKYKSYREWWPYKTVEKSDDTISALDGRTAGRTDRNAMSMSLRHTDAR